MSSPNFDELFPVGFFGYEKEVDTTVICRLQKEIIFVDR